MAYDLQSAPHRFAPGSTAIRMMIGEVSTIEEELALAQADARDMKRTVIALRTELEAAHAEIHDATLRAIQSRACCRRRSSSQPSVMSAAMRLPCEQWIIPEARPSMLSPPRGERVRASTYSQAARTRGSAP